MKKLSKLSALLLSGAMLFSLAACSGGQGSAATPTPPADYTTPSQAPAGGSDEKFTVGICQLAPHPALDAATQGFKDYLTETFGENITFTEGNAGGEFANCGTIVDGFLSEEVDLILANATSPLQAAASATSEIPILGTSVTNYAVALGLDDVSTQVIGGNISGTSDLAPLDEQAAMLQEMFPEAKNVGLLYCSAEPNSVYQIETISGYLTDMGYTCTPYAFTDVNDLASVTQTACDSSDVIYIPTDNTAANNTETIANVVIPAGVPVIAGESGICSGCGVATLSISYYELGQTAGEMAAKILRGEADVSTMPIEYAPNVTKMYHEGNCNALGITPPESYEAITE
ncbi:MAG: ABC transporter substrate-binding protein [Oscillospiraceae bacterium]|nr:ABC transporter substrate-binding protein [Oscillospiraceae bacterium]